MYGDKLNDVLDISVNQEDEAMNIDQREDDDNVVLEDFKRAAKNRKGRGHESRQKTEGIRHPGVYDTIPTSNDDVADTNAQRSVEGYILMCVGLHEESHEDDIQNKFSEYGEVKNLHLNLDRRTGFLKGYALIEYETFKEANTAKEALNGTELLGATISVDWAFNKKPRKVRPGRK